MPEWIETKLPEPVQDWETVCPSCRVVYNRHLGQCPDEHSREALFTGFIAGLGPEYFYQAQQFPLHVLMGINDRLHGGRLARLDE